MASISTCAPRGSSATPTVTRAGGAVLEERPVDLVDVGEGAEVGHVDRHPHGCASDVPAASHTACEVLQAARGLLGGRRTGELGGLGIQRDLTRAEQEVADAHRVAVGADRGGRLGRIDCLALGWHRLRAYTARPDPGDRP